MVSEKLRSLLRLGTLSTRYKDIFDIYYLFQHIDKDKLKVCLSTYILDDAAMRENSMQDIYRRISMILNNRVYRNNLDSVDINWLEEDVDTVVKGVLDFIRLF